MNMLLNENHELLVEMMPEEEPKEDNGDVVFYGTKELAGILHCSVPTAREVMRRKDFPLIIVGGKWLVLKKALEEWAMSKRV